MTLQEHRFDAGHHFNWSKFLMDHYLHAAERLKSRYGIELTYEAWERLNERFFNERDVEFLFNPNQITSLYKMTIRGNTVGVFFSETAFCITSFIPDTDERLQGIRPDGTKGGDRNYLSPLRMARLQNEADPLLWKLANG